MSRQQGPIQSPKGTRDFYPEEMLRRRYITDAWRRTALRHGFDEIDGPVFEHRELYEKKSGEGILNEMFSVFSGKDPGQREAMERGEPAPFGLRPEFTPTLARMYAAKARQLPNPCKWFCVSNFFRAERPQRGRLREFFQWNCDVVGGGDASTHDAQIIAVIVGLLNDLALGGEQSTICLNIAGATERLFNANQIFDDTVIRAAAAHIDAYSKMPVSEWRTRAKELLFTEDLIAILTQKFNVDVIEPESSPDYSRITGYRGGRELIEIQRELQPLRVALDAQIAGTYWSYSPSIVRGLAYYTGTVFEVIAEGERAVAGGGRYDNLIELFGGPPTPACGFGMGDVVLENLLNDHNLMPTGRDLVRALSEPMPVRPDVFIVTNGDAGAEQQLVPTLAALRRGVLADGQREPWDPNRYTIPPMHARRTYKATTKIGKLKADADAQHARLFVILESDERCTVQDLDGIADARRDVPIDGLGAAAAEMLRS